jgi:hypothetical protein
MSEPSTRDEPAGPTVVETAPGPSTVGTTAKLLAPAASLAAGWGVRKAMDSAYRRSTGNPPPRAGDPDASLRKVLLWAAMTAAVLAVANVVIDRLAARWES